MKHYYYYGLLRILTFSVSLLLPAFCTYADEMPSLTFKDLKAAYRLGETVHIRLETRAFPHSLVDPVDLWVAIELPTGQPLLFVVDDPANPFSFTPQPFKQGMTLAETTDLLLQVKATDALAGNYVLYALYSETNTAFEQLLASSRSNLAIAQTTLAASSGLDIRPQNSACIAPPRPTKAKPFPQKLSETGCVMPDNPTQPTAGVIFYRVNSLLWTDGAFKRRWLALPDNTHITISEEGHWRFPSGAVLMKDFYLGEQPVETRLLVHHPDGEWAGYSYEWDDDGTDATLLVDGKTKEVNGQTWIYPSRAQCIECHNKGAMFSLGLETAQMNRLHTYAKTGRTASQIDTLAHIGLLEAGIVTSEQPAFPEPTDNTASIESRARAYLHTNCSFCHRAENNPKIPHDYRFTAPLSELCSELVLSDSGKPKTQLLTAGYPEYSLISLRMHSRNPKLMMPPLGSMIVDPEGTALVDEWIFSLSECPQK